MNSRRFVFWSCFVLVVVFSAQESAHARRRKVRNCNQRVTAFSLINAEKHRPIRTYRRIRNGAIIDLAKLPTTRINIRAVTTERKTPRIRSIRFALNGFEAFNVQNTRPFALAGKVRSRKYRRWTPGVGSYVLTAVPYCRSQAQGKEGRPLTIHFQVVNTRVGRRPRPTPSLRPTPAGTPPPPIPQLAVWEANMKEFGNRHCNVNELDSDPACGYSVCYYDGANVFYQIAEYTGDDSWLVCAEQVRDHYRDYIFGLENIQGWKVFPDGLATDWYLNQDELSREAVIFIADHSSWTYVGGGADSTLSRETAYMIRAYMRAEEMGAPPYPKLPDAVNFALGHIDQWAISKTAVYVKPFMVGLTMEALIAYYEKTEDPRIPPAIKRAVDFLMDESGTWIPQQKTFLYIDHEYPGEDPPLPAPDVNNLIAPAFAWLYHYTGEQKYQEWGDQIFEGGVLNSYLKAGKQFSQNYRSSFDYVAWRSAVPETKSIE